MKKLISLLLIFSLLSVMGLFSVSCSKEALSDIDDNTINVIKPTIKFESNGGSKVSSQTTKVIKEEPQTTRENYLFDGWYLDANFKSAAIFPLSVEYDTTLYAKWIKIYDTATAKAITISGKKDYESSHSFNVTPSGFDFDALAERGLKLNITVSYDVSYYKDYDVLWDVGYMGAPRYEVYLLDKDLAGNYEEDVTAPSSAKTKTISMCTSAEYFKNNTITLTFSTNNVQNAVRVKNISVTYSCGR